MNIRLVACCLAGAVILFGGAYIATAEQLSKSLPKVESALSSSESALARIDPKSALRTVSGRKIHRERPSSGAQ
jgi:hypothetical protein